MKFEGIHHVTCITADAPGNVDFYVRVLGLRLVKKSVNQDDPTVYHLFYADEKGSAGSDITFFEYPQARRGRAGSGMVHRIVFRVGSDEALDFWAERLTREGITVERDGRSLRFEDPEGLGLEIAAVETEDEPLIADNPEIPSELALQGFDGVRAYANPEPSERFLETTLSFEPTGEANGKLGASSVVRGTRTTRRRSSPGFRVPARFITSRGRRRSTSTRNGRSASPRAARTRRR